MRMITISILILLLSAVWHPLEAQEKSTTLALVSSVGMTAALIGVGFGTEDAEWVSVPATLTGLVVAPSLGHFYAEQWKTGCIFTGSRVVVCGATLLLISNVEEKGLVDELFGFSKMARAAYAAGGFVALTLITLADWAYVPESVREHNEKLQIKPELNLKDKKYGVGFTYHF